MDGEGNERMKMIVIAAILIFTTPAHALDCAPSPDRSNPGSSWRYRVINSKQCWYRNESALPKSELTWNSGRRPELDMQFGAKPKDQPSPITPKLVQTISYRVESQEQPLNRGLIAIALGGLGCVFAIGGLLWPLWRRRV